MSRARCVPRPLLVWRRLRRLAGGTSRQTALAVADQLVFSGTSFVAGILVARQGGKAELGAYALGMTIVYLLVTMQGCFLVTPYWMRVPHLSKGARRRFTGSVLVHQTVICAVATSLLFIAAGTLQRAGGPPELGAVMWALAWTIPLLLLREHARTISIARLWPGITLSVDLVVATVQLSGLALLASRGWLSAGRAIWLMGAACAVPVLGWLVWMRLSHRLSLRSGGILRDLGHNWTLGKWVFASGAVWCLITYLFPWVLAGFHGTTAAGALAACMGVVGLMNPLFVGAQNSLGANIAHGYAAVGRAGIRRLVARTALLSGLLLTPVLFLLLVLGGDIVALVYGAQYAGYGLVVGCLALSVFVAAVDFSISRGLMALGRGNLEFLGSAASAVAVLAAGPVLIWQFGPLGVALSLLLCNCVAALVRYVMFFSQTRAAAVRGDDALTGERHQVVPQRESVALQDARVPA